MKIREIHIKNYKSLCDLKILEPNPFTVLFGPNGAGKSNIFESLEFVTSINHTDLQKVVSSFGGINQIFCFKNNKEEISHLITLDDGLPHSINIQINNIDGQVNFAGAGVSLIGKYHISSFNNPEFKGSPEIKNIWREGLENPSAKQFFDQFSRIFVNNSKILRQQISDDIKLNNDCSNLEKVLKRVLKDESKREEIIEWLDLLVPGFESIEIRSEELSGTDVLLIHEKGTQKPFSKYVISDGTYNILSLLTAVFQSDEPQFLCIEEPENGLNPKVQKELVNLFRQKCEDEGHYIWLNTHSQTIVSRLEPKEAILVEKINGATQIKSLKDFNLHGLMMDEAWLSNALGGGIPW